MFERVSSRASRRLERACSGWPCSSDCSTEASISSTLDSSCIGPSWIASARRRRTSDSWSSVRRESARARRRPRDSAVRSAPTISAEATQDTANTLSYAFSRPSSTGTSVAAVTGIRITAGSAPIRRLRSAPWKCAWAATRNSATKWTGRVELRLDALEDAEHHEVADRHDHAQPRLW